MERGERLEPFLTQPFYVAAEYTHRPGAWVPLLDTLAGVRRILEGGADARHVTELRYLGSLP